MDVYKQFEVFEQQQQQGDANNNATGRGAEDSNHATMIAESEVIFERELEGVRIAAPDPQGLAVDRGDLELFFG